MGSKPAITGGRATNIVATAKKGDLRLVVIVLGSPTAGIRDAFVKEKINQYFRK